MKRIKIKMSFYDVKLNRTVRKDEEFEVSDERFKELTKKREDGLVLVEEIKDYREEAKKAFNYYLENKL